MVKIMNKILIIDDQKPIRNALREILEYEKYVVDEASEGRMALKMIKNYPYDLIFCDIKMPQIDGIELLKKVTELKFLNPIIMISGHGDIETAVQTLKLGAYDYIEKPLDLNRVLTSVKNAFELLKNKVEIINNPSEIKNADGIILPGVGAFGNAIKNLQELRLIEPIKEAVIEKKVPLLGICLGMQILTEKSQEGKLNGLGWISGEAKKFKADQDIKVPHMGWNYVEVNKNSKLSNGLSHDSKFYFVHSYYVNVKNNEESAMKTNYSLEFDSAIEKDNIFGVQFHPEKSHKYGMQLLKNFSDV